MDKEEKLSKHYQQTRRELEEQEAEIKSVQRKGQQVADETYSEIRYLLSDSENLNEILNEARQELSRLEEDFMLALSHERRKVIRKQDECEQSYRNELQKLREGD